RALLRAPERCSASSRAVGAPGNSRGAARWRSASERRPALSHRATGTDSPRFLRRITASGTSPRAASFNIALVVKPRTLSGAGDELLEQELERDLAGGGRQAVDQPAERRSCGEPAIQPRRLVAEVRRVAAEQLVRALAREDHFDMLPGRLGQEKRR